MANQRAVAVTPVLKNQIWEDIKTIITLIKNQYNNTPILLGGHSSESGFLLNYLGNFGQANLSGVVFLSPQWGFRSNTTKPDISKFASVKIPLFAFNVMSFGLAFGHSVAVTFNIPGQVKLDPRIVTSNTVNMANALTPSNPEKQLVSSIFCFWLEVMTRL